MQVFVPVVEQNGFARAADKLGLPRASVTTIIQNLEAHLGTSLLQRTTRRLSLTADGELFHERSLRILAEMEEVEAGLIEGRRHPKGRLHCGSKPETKVLDKGPGSPGIQGGAVSDRPTLRDPPSMDDGGKPFPAPFWQGVVPMSMTRSKLAWMMAAGVSLLVISLATLQGQAEEEPVAMAAMPAVEVDVAPVVARKVVD